MRGKKVMPKIPEIDDAARRFDRSYASDPTPKLHTKIGKYTGRKLYSYDQAYWFASEASAWQAFMKLRGTNDD